MVSWRVLNLVSLYQITALALATAVAYLAAPPYAVAVFIGGAFGTVNFLALRHLVQQGFAGGKKKLVYGFFLATKMVTALGVMAGLLIILRLHPLAFGAGLTTMFVGLGLAVAHVYFKPLAAPAAD